MDTLDTLPVNGLTAPLAQDAGTDAGAPISPESSHLLGSESNLVRLAVCSEDGSGTLPPEPAVQAAAGSEPSCQPASPLQPAGAALALTEKQIRTARHKLDQLIGWSALKRTGLSGYTAARRLRVNHSTLWRWERAVLATGHAIPNAPGDLDAAALGALVRALGPAAPEGRRFKYPLTQNEALVLRGFVLAKSTQDATHFALAVEEFANHPACTPAIRTLILAELDRAARNRSMPNWPLSIRRAGMPTQQEAAWFRGRKHAQNLEQVTLRGCYWVDETGKRRELEAHSIWESDDASDNEPRRSIDPDTGEQILTRQALWTQDVFSAAMLGLTQVARARDAYRIEDVADHMLNCVNAWGLPRFMRLEMGEIWNGRFFHGFVPTEPGCTWTVSGWPDDEPWGGLSPLVHVVNVHKSKGKGGIEGSFNMIQAIAAHHSLSIGRSRGEFEEASHALVRSHRVEEIDERFWTMDRSSEVMRAVAERFNQRPKFRRMLGGRFVPADLLRDKRGLPLLPSEAWRFCPVKRTATVRGGHVEVSVDHYPRKFRFCVNGVNDQLHLDHGYRVLIAFHPGRPHEGCWVFNCECGVRNRDGLRRGEKLILAPLAEEVPQIDLSQAGDFTTRRKASAAVRRSFRAIGAALKADYAQDSSGSDLTVRQTANGRTVAAHSPLRGSVTADAPPPPRPQPQREPDDYIEAILDRTD